MRKNNSKTFRPRLSEWELKTFRRMVDDDYRLMRRNLRYQRHRKHRSNVYPIEEQEKHLKKMGRLLKKLNRLLNGRYAINP